MILNDYSIEIQSLLNEKKTYSEIELALKQNHGDSRGFSERSIRRFCKENNLRGRINNQELQYIVADTIQQVLI
jgi:hypothetical protein